MYFYEVFRKCDLEVVVHEFLKLAVDSSDINVTEKVFRGAIKNLNEMEPVKSDTEILCIEKIQERINHYLSMRTFEIGLQR